MGRQLRCVLTRVLLTCPGALSSLMMSAGLLAHRATLDGSTDGITCIDFSPTVSLLT